MINKHGLFRYALLALLMIPSAVNATDQYIVTNRPVGSSYNILSDQVSSTSCVTTLPGPAPTDLTLGEEVRNSRGQTIDGVRQVFRHTFFETTSQLFSATGATAAGRVGFGSFSASGSYQYAASKKVSDRYLYLYISNRIVRDTIPGRFELSRDLPDSVTGSRDSFYRRCGTHFIAATTQSALFEAIIEIRYRDESEASDIRGALTAKYSGASASAEQQRTFSSAIRSGRIEATIISHGPLVSTEPSASAIEDVVEYARNFGEKIAAGEAAGQAVWVQQYASVEPYSMLSDVSDDMGAEVLALQEAAEAIDAARTEIANFELILRDSQIDGLTSTPLERAAVRAQIAALGSHVRNLQRVALACSRNPKEECHKIGAAIAGKPDELSYEFVRWVKLPKSGSTTLFLSDGQSAKLLIGGRVICTGQGPGPIPCHGGQETSASDWYTVRVNDGSADPYSPNRVFRGPIRIHIESRLTDERWADETERIRAALVEVP